MKFLGDASRHSSIKINGKIHVFTTSFRFTPNGNKIVNRNVSVMSLLDQNVDMARTDAGFQNLRQFEILYLGFEAICRFALYHPLLL